MAQSSQLQTQENKLNAQQAEITILKQEKTQMTSQLNQAMSEIKTLGHVETGHIFCGSSHTWPIKDNLLGRPTQYKDISQQFTQSYSSTPTVMLSVENMSTSFSDNAVRYEVSVHAVDQSSFTLRCLTWDNSWMGSLRVKWISVPY